MVQITTFAGTSPYGQKREIADDLGWFLDQRRSVQAKEAARSFAPTLFNCDYRAAVNAVAVTLGVLDYDYLDVATKTPLQQQHMQQVIEHFNSLGVTGVWYTTFSHTLERCKFRVVLLLKQALTTLHNWSTHYWPALAAYGSVGGVRPDPQCKDVSHFYFLPSNTQDAAAWAVQGSFTGEDGGVDLEHLAATHVRNTPAQPTHRTPHTQHAHTDVFAAAFAGQTPRTRRLTKDDLCAFRDRLKQRRSAAGIAAYECLKAVLKGRAWGDADTRNDRISNLCYMLEKDYRGTLDVVHLSQHFAASCQEMQRQPDKNTEYTVEYVQRKMLEKIEAVSAREEVYRQKDKSEYLAELKRWGYDEPYSVEYVEKLRDKGVFSNCLLLQYKSVCWVYTHTGYHPFTCSDNDIAIRRFLMPFVEHGVELDFFNRFGEKKMHPNKTLISKYGNAVQTYLGSLYAQESSYDIETATFTEACCPLVKLEPKFNVHIDGWLKVLAGSKYEVLNSWLAWCTALDHPCSMLVLEGDPGAGKTMLANGLARLWGRSSATPLKEALDSFNSQLTKCPMLLADDGIPKDHYGKPKFEALRDLVSRTGFIVNEKYTPRHEVKGAVRIIITTNDLETIVAEAPESSEAIAAVLERIVRIRVKSNATQYLKALKSADIQWGVDEIAQHALYLRMHRPVPQTASRFLFDQTDPELAAMLVESSNLYVATCAWFIGFLQDPERLYAQASGAEDPCWTVKVTDRYVFATPYAVLKGWSVYNSQYRTPSLKALRKAWVGLEQADKTTTTVWTPAGAKHTRRIDLSLLTTWSEKYMYGDAASIRSCVQKYLLTGIYKKAVEAFKARPKGASVFDIMTRRRLT